MQRTAAAQGDGACQALLLLLPSTKAVKQGVRMRMRSVFPAPLPAKQLLL